MNDDIPEIPGLSPTPISPTEAVSPVATYLMLSRSVGYSLLFVIPLILIYEVGVRITSGGALRIGADVWLREFLASIGLSDTMLLGGLLLAGTIAVIIFEKRRGVRYRPAIFGGMLLESLVYAIASGVIVGRSVAGMFNMIWPPRLQIGGTTGLGQELVLSIGAGIYEELFFRLLLVSAIMGVLWIVASVLSQRGILFPRTFRYIIAALVGAAIFSWVHYIGPYGDPFTIESFTFRFMMGLVLNVIFLYRGFGIAAMTHSLYDVVVTLSLL